MDTRWADEIERSFGDGPTPPAPATYVEAQLRGIVGIEFTVTGVEGKAKLSQNRSDADRAGVAAGLAADGADPDGLVAP